MKLTDDELLDAAQSAGYFTDLRSLLKNTSETNGYASFCRKDIIGYGRKVEALTIERQAAISAELLASLKVLVANGGLVFSGWQESMFGIEAGNSLGFV